MRKIFVIDDDAVFLESLVDYLDLLEGYVIVGHAPHGAAALERLSALPTLPDVIICDVMMPVMDGFSFAAAAHERFGLSHVILLTAADIHRMRRRLPSPGVRNVWSKLKLIDELPDVLNGVR